MKILLVGLILLLIFLDQVSKIWVVNHFLPSSSFPVIEGFFNITLIKNPGAAFGFLANASTTLRSFFFILISLLAIGLIIYYLSENRPKRMTVTVALSLILSGAVGNLIDRIRSGAVIDFLDFYVGKYHWPAFNVADSVITIGAFLIILDYLRQNKHVKKA